MPKLKRQRARQKFNYNTNRKRVKQRMEKNEKYNVKVDCPILKEAWNNRISVKENMKKLGVAVDANAAVSKIKTSKEKFLDAETERETPRLEKTAVIARLEMEAAVTKPPSFRFSGEQVKWISFMMDKHKFDFKAMARDPKNSYQETPKVIEHKIRKFISIPEHYAVYCKERGLLDKLELPNENTEPEDSTEVPAEDSDMKDASISD